MNETQQKEFDKTVELLLYGGLDYCHNVEKDQYWWFSPINPYYCEAFGMYQALRVLGYGYFGAINVPDEFNLRYQLRLKCDAVESVGLELGDRESYEWCKKKYLEM